MFARLNLINKSSLLKPKSCQDLFGQHSKSPYRRGRSLEKTNLQFTPEVEPLPPSQGNLKPSYLKPFIFTVSFSGACFAGATIWQYENMRKRAMQMKQNLSGWFDKNFSSHDKLGHWRSQANNWWQQQNIGEKTFYGILFFNALVFLAWKVPRLQRVMITYFAASPFSRAVCWPMFLSTFSHYSLLHLGANMYVLHSFATGACASMGQEQFLAFYLSAGVFSSFVSHVMKSVALQTAFSLGASGALMGVLGYYCSKYPNSRLGIAFVPSFTFTADTGLKALIAFDTVGLLLRWKLFDHAAHLGGALFGLFWYHWGQDLIWKRRGFLMDKWHSLRTKPRDI